ncbi:MAG: hypothetical protein Q9217_002686 [Psora testacea]
MENSNHTSTEELIKSGVANHVALQQLNPHAISDGIDRQKAFDADTRITYGVEPQAGDMQGCNGNPATHDENAATEVERNSESAKSPMNPDLEDILPDGPEIGKGAGEHEVNLNNVDPLVAPQKKKKKKKKPKSQRGLNAATGFEEYYVDPPLTPQQHEEEKGLYDRRIETAIQRYVAKRNLNSDRKNLFDKYLTFGGIEGGPKMFSGGLDVCTTENSNAAEIAMLTATHSVAFDKSDPRNETYVVDFEGCLKAFLSSRLPGTFELIEDAKIKDYVGVIRNFLNYLLHHDVCPEYRDQVEASRKVCNQAETELIKIARARTLLPGTFNKACSEIFGGMYKGMYTASESWMKDEDREQSLGISPQYARQVFKIGLAAYATDEQIEKYKLESKKQTFSVVSEQDMGLEVTSIALGRSLPEIQALYNHAEAKTLPILGKLHAKTWHSPSSPEEDLTADEEAELARNPLAHKDYEFWVEDVLLDKLFVGMKLEATVKQLNFGIWYFDAVFGVHCSFFTFLPNEMMIGWRAVEKEWLPPRSMEYEGDQEVQNEDKRADYSATDEREESHARREAE